LTSEFFYNVLEARPFVRLQGEEFKTDSTVATPTHHALLNHQGDFMTRHMDAEFEGGSGMHGRWSDDPAASQGQIDDVTLPAYAVDRTEGTPELDWEARMMALVHGLVTGIKGQPFILPIGFSFATFFVIPA
jgi:hypothetical protein